MYPVKNCESQQAQAYNEYRHMIVPDGSGGQGVSVYDPEARMPESRRPISPREG